jgi:hypothetical protein
LIYKGYLLDMAAGLVLWKKALITSGSAGGETSGDLPSKYELGS